MEEHSYFLGLMWRRPVSVTEAAMDWAERYAEAFAVLYDAAESRIDEFFDRKFPDAFSDPHARMRLPIEQVHVLLDVYPGGRAEYCSIHRIDPGLICR